MTSDIIIGFEEEPEGLESFLDEQGYALQPPVENEEDLQYFQHREKMWPQIFYYPSCLEGGYDIKSLLNINFPTSDSDAIEEAERLSKEIVRGLDGFLYDSNLDEFFGKDEL